MSFQEQFWLTVIDKGLLAITVVLIAGLVKWLLQIDQAKRDVQKEIACLRANAYSNLWKATEKIHRESTIDKNGTSEISKCLDTFYFDKSGAMYISHPTTMRFFALRDVLSKFSDRQSIKEASRSLRGQIKLDLGVYSRKDVKTPVR